MSHAQECACGGDLNKMCGPVGGPCAGLNCVCASVPGWPQRNGLWWTHLHSGPPETIKPPADETGISDLFPGDGLEIPTDGERDRADALLAEWAARWGEAYTQVARVHPPAIRTGLFASGLEGLPTNRAFVRAQLRRFFKHPTGVKA